MPTTRRSILIVFALLALASPAFGNGGYIPQRAYPNLPGIPVQRAVIVHRQGVETLMVESAFDTPSPDVAWVLPLPAEPTKLEVGEPGMVASACMALRPEIIHDLHESWRLPLVVWLALLPFALAAVTMPDRSRRHSRYVTILACEVLLAAVLLPALSTAGGSAATEAAGVSVTSAQRLGDYDVSVLHAADGKALDRWLSGQSMRPLDAAAGQVVADYAARGWCLLVTRLHRDAGGAAVPRPLIATFPATAPIFPMKLTALANTKTHVELCAIADQEVAAAGFHCVVADRFGLHSDEHDEFRYSGDRYKQDKSPYFVAAQTELKLGSPDVSARMWDGCTVTKLTADLSPAAMSQDIVLSLRPLAAHRDWRFTSLSRRQIALAILLWGLVLCTLTAAVLGRRGRGLGRRQWKRLLSLALAITAATGATWLLLPTIPVRTLHGYHRLRWQSNMKQLAMGLDFDHAVHVGMTSSEIAAIPQRIASDPDCRTEWARNPYTDETIRPESSPGNFNVRVIDGVTYFCAYDVDGVEWRWEITTPATTDR